MHVKRKIFDYSFHLLNKKNQRFFLLGTFCGFMSDNYTNRLKSCNNCGKTIDRDANGSRNILLKNLKEPIKKDYICVI